MQEQRDWPEILRLSCNAVIDVSQEIISFIGVSFDELNSMPMNQLEQKITKNITPYFDTSQLSLDEKIKMREDIKETRKLKFHFSQEITKDIPKDRIQLGLSHLAKLFRALNNEIKQSQGNA